MDTRIAPGNGMPLQRRKRRDCRLTKKACKTFLDHLAASCNAKAAARAAGYATTSSFYMLRREDEMFAAAWREAMQLGYDRLEEALLSRALGQFGEMSQSDGDRDQLAADPDAVAIELVDEHGNDTAGKAGLALAAAIPAAVARTDIQLALALLNRQAAIARNGPARPRSRANAEEVAAAVSAKLDRLADQLARQQR